MHAYYMYWMSTKYISAGLLITGDMVLYPEHQSIVIQPYTTEGEP